MAHNPIEQFQITPIVDLKIAGVNVSFTNSSAMMVLAVVLITAFLTLSVRSRALVPGRWQSMAEVFYEFIANMLRDNVGAEGRRYFPFIFTLFMFVLFGNVLGLIPGGFAFTSHVIVTFGMAAVVFIGVTIIGFYRHGLHFLRMFFPEGAPLATAVILVPIELISYFSRPFSLAVRLFANMLAGHITLQVFGAFVLGLLGAGFWSVLSPLPLAATVAMFALELLVACLQAFVFSVLTCVYLRDALHPGH